MRDVERRACFRRVPHQGEQIRRHAVVQRRLGASVHCGTESAGAVERQHQAATVGREPGVDGVAGAVAVVGDAGGGDRLASVDAGQDLQAAAQFARMGLPQHGAVELGSELLVTTSSGLRGTAWRSLFEMRRTGLQEALGVRQPLLPVVLVVAEGQRSHHSSSLSGCGSSNSATDAARGGDPAPASRRSAPAHAISIRVRHLRKQNQKASTETTPHAVQQTLRHC